MGQPLRAVDAAGFVVVRDHRVLVPQQVQFAVGGVGRALLGGQAPVLPERQQIEVAADDPRQTLTFVLVEHFGHRCHLRLQGVIRLAGAFQMGIEYRQLPAIAERQFGREQGIFWLKLTADEIGRGHRQLQAFGVFDAVAAEGCQLPANAAKDVRIGDEIGLPVKGMGAARVQVGDALLQQLELVLIIAGLGAVIEFLQQHHIGLLVANHPRHFVEAEGHVFRGRRFIIALRQIIPEHVTLAGQVLHVPGHDLQGLARHQRRRRSGATDRQGFAGVGAPGQAVDQPADQDEGEQGKRNGVAQ